MTIKTSRKTSRKPRRKTNRKTSRKPRRKASRKTSRKPRRKASRKTSRKPRRKTSRKKFRVPHKKRPRRNDGRKHTSGKPRRPFINVPHPVLQPRRNVPDLIRKLLHDEYEMCGIIKDGKILPLSRGTVYEGRNTCSLPGKYKNEKILWHTHPMSAKFYPSKEDFLKVIKSNPGRQSIIFTPFGRWIIEKRSNKQTQPKYLIEKIKTYNDNLYKETYQPLKYNEYGQPLEISTNEANAKLSKLSFTNTEFFPMYLDEMKRLLHTVGCAFSWRMWDR